MKRLTIRIGQAAALGAAALAIWAAPARAETWRFDPEVLSVLRNEVLPAYDAIVG